MSNKKYRLLKDTPDCLTKRVGEWGTGNAVENVLNRLRNYKK